MAKKQNEKENKKEQAITPSEAIGAFERAFRSGSPDAVENLLRDILNVQVAVVQDKQEAEQELAAGKRLKTIPVPYGVFLREVERILKAGVYCLKPNPSGGAARAGPTGRRAESPRNNSAPYVLSPVSSTEEILPGRTYVLLSTLAGYSSTEGLTFSGPGSDTGFETQPEAERREKFTEGRFQTWQDHARGVWQRSERVARFFRPFVQSWAEHVLNDQWKDNINQKEQFVEGLLWAMRIATLLHDVGKLNERWQDVAWENEQTIRGKHINWQQSNQFIARTSPIPNDEIRKKIRKPPFHAPFAYPFLRAFLRKLLGDYRLLDAISLAIARHHCLEVTGAVEKGSFELADKADALLQQSLMEILDKLSENEKNTLNNALSEALQAVKQGTEVDEPPSPSDDFYLIYCLANRMVKICDWEDASGKSIELPDGRE